MRASGDPGSGFIYGATFRSGRMWEITIVIFE
jgi:hypothetical protein